MSLFVPTANKGVAVGEDNHQRKEEEAIREQKRSLISLTSWAPAESAEARQGGMERGGRTVMFRGHMGAREI